MATEKVVYGKFKFQTAIMHPNQRKDYMQLTHNESVIIRLRFGIETNDPMTYEEIAEVVGISKSMVPPLEKKALRKLKHIENRSKMHEIKDTIDYINTPIH